MGRRGERRAAWFTGKTTMSRHGCWPWRGVVMDASVSAVEALNHGASWWKTSRMVHRQDDDEPARMQAVARYGGAEVTPPAEAK